MFKLPLPIIIVIDNIKNTFYRNIEEEKENYNEKKKKQIKKLYITLLDC